MSRVSIRNWGEYQHYKDRRPPWVKLHVRILEDEDFRSFSPTTRLVAVLLLAVAANRDNQIPNNPAWLAEEMGLPAKSIANALADLLADGYLIRTENAMPRDRDREQRQSSNKQTSYVSPERAVEKLLENLKDKDATTKRTVVSLCNRYRLAEGDVMWALECATGPGVESPTRVAVAELKKRGEGRRAA